MTKLSHRFIVPPFSILDRRTAAWARRRAHWEDLGLFNADGRPVGITYDNPLMADPNYLKKKDAKERELGRPLSKKEFNDKYYDWERGVGYTSRFDPLLAEICYAWFCQPGGAILDPFAGGAARGCVAALTGHPYVGIDIYAEQIHDNREKARKLNIPLNLWPQWIVGDSREMLKLVKPESVDFIFSCPPYYNVEIYGRDPRELSNCPDYDSFAKDYSKIIRLAVKALKPNRFAAFEVGDVRLPDGHYGGLPTTTVEAFQNAGAGLYNTIIVLDPAGTAGLRAGRQFSAGRKVVRTHQELLVFFKGDPRLIRANPIDNSLDEPAPEPFEEWSELL